MTTFLGVALAAVLLAILVQGARAAGAEYGRDRVPALLYHRLLPAGAIAAARSGDDLSYVVETESFAAQMEHLRQAGYTTIHLDDFLAWREGSADLPPKPILITCDDGFESIHRYAFPVWRKHGMKATVFMTPDRESANFRKHATFDAPLSDAHLVELSRNGVAIESHGLTHRYLSDLSGDEALFELRESKRRLESITGRPVRFLAVPSGAYSGRVRRLAAETGYRAVFAMLQGTNSRSSDLYSLRRLSVGREIGLDDFRRLLTPGAAIQRRFTSAMLNGLRVTLGSRRLDRLYVRLTRLGVRRLLQPRRLAIVAGLALAILAAIVARMVFGLMGGR